MKNKIKYALIGFIIGGIVFGSVGIIAYSYQASDISYTTSHNNQVSNVEQAINDLYVKSQSCSRKLNDVAEVGDFVYMVPSYVGSYTPTTNSSSPYYTGTSSPGSIIPSELTKWVIIKKNNDGTLEMVSKDVSSSRITFYGELGYKNFVGALNEIAKQYTNIDFIDTTKIRHMGYLLNSSIEQCSNFCEGDTYYETDVNLVKNAMKVRGSETLISSIANTSTNEIYFLASRYFDGTGNISYRSWYVGTDGNLSTEILCRSNGSSSANSSKAIRPIVTTKENVKVLSGSGSENNPWVLSN